jgi:FtsP/CotA-like multicopper oxidase with cupredoxin domain
VCIGHLKTTNINVISADGWYNTSRMVVVANGTMPGPPLIVYEGQQLIINVVNKLPSEQVTIHWHGLPQKGWEYMDGVPFLSQCPIQSGESFYRPLPLIKPEW